MGAFVGGAVDGTRGMMWGLVLIWGTAFVSIKVLGEVLTPLELTWFRYVPFLLVFAVWLALRRRDRFAKVRGADWVRYAVAGALGVLGYHLPLNFATSSLTAGEPITGGMAAILVATTPLWTLFYLALGGKRPSRRVVVGALVAFAGVAIVVLLGRPGQGLDAAWKAAVGLLAPILWSGFNIVAKPLADRYGSLFTAGVTNGIGTLMLVPAGLSFGLEPLADFETRHWLWLAYLSLAATVGGYILWNTGLKRLGPAQVTAYIFAIPVVATAAGALLIAEPVTLWFLAGAGLVLYGLWQVQRKEQSA